MCEYLGCDIQPTSQYPYFDISRHVIASIYAHKSLRVYRVGTRFGTFITAVVAREEGSTIFLHILHEVIVPRRSRF